MVFDRVGERRVGVKRPLSRRLRTIPVLILLTLAVWALFVPLLIVAAVVDIVRWSIGRTHWMSSRLVLFLLAYVTAETAGIIALATVWVASGFGSRRAPLQKWTFGIQKRWAGALMWTALRVFGLRIEAEGADAVSRPPFLLFARHTSIIDNLLHTHLVSRPHGIHLRYVMKAELLVDPAIDVAGNRLPNAFVRRGADDTDAAIEAIRQLTAEAGSGEGVLIYPEGTRFSEAKLVRALKGLERRNPELHARAKGFRHVLPPRLGGPLAMLAASDSDVVFMGHHGLGGFARVADIWSGALVGRLISVRYWRVPRGDIPDARADRVDWLFDWWGRIDEWVATKEGT